MAKSAKSTTLLPSGASLSGLSSHQAGDQSYRVPSTSGGFLPANPIKFCLRFKPPTIALVYQLTDGNKKPHKYVREFKVDLREGADLNDICDDLFLREPTYFNQLSKVQVRSLPSLITRVGARAPPKAVRPQLP